jgi:hypothetical protein
MTKEELCPECLGSKEKMVGRKNAKGFKYEECKDCDENGMVPEGSLDKIFINDDY